jgi:hypothetical protein
MEEIMAILRIIKIGSTMNTLERFHIYNEKRIDNPINNKCTVKYNLIFNTLIHKNSLPVSAVELAQSQTITPAART